jgi:hypothetical protein
MDEGPAAEAAGADRLLNICRIAWIENQKTNIITPHNFVHTVRTKYAALALVLVAVLSFASLMAMPASGDDGLPTIGTNQPADGEVNIGIYLLSLSNFDPLKGTYDLEFYVYMFWNPQLTSEPNLQVINAIKVTNETVSRTYNMGGEGVWIMYRASLFTTPDVKHYPFDTLALDVVLEDDAHDISNVTFLWTHQEQVLDSMFQTEGWNQKGMDFNTTEHSYPWGDTYSQAHFSLVLERKAISSTANILLPPVIFCFVSFLAFIISPVKENPLMVRLSLGTGMIISAVLFHVAQSSALPPFGEIRQLDIIMISSYMAIALSILVTVLCSVYHTRGAPDEKVLQLNREGLMIALAAPFITYAVLYLLFV